MAVALLGLAVALQTVTRRIEQFTAQSAARLMPCACSASASRRTLLQVQRNGESGSPRVVGSTSASRSDISVGSPAFARAGSWLSPVCVRPPAGEPAPALPPRPIPSDPARSCSAPSRLLSPLQYCHHSPRHTLPPPRPDDGPAHQGAARRLKIAPEWARYRSLLQHMVSKHGCKP